MKPRISVRTAMGITAYEVRHAVSREHRKAWHFIVFGWVLGSFSTALACAVWRAVLG